MKLKNAYYFIICLVSLFVLSWGIVDLAGAGIGLATARSPMIAAEPSAEPLSSASAPDASMDIFYQKKMLYERLSDSLARIVVAGLIFAYSRIKVRQLEK